MWSGLDLEGSTCPSPQQFLLYLEGKVALLIHDCLGWVSHISHAVIPTGLCSALPCYFCLCNIQAKLGAVLLRCHFGMELRKVMMRRGLGFSLHLCLHSCVFSMPWSFLFCSWDLQLKISRCLDWHSSQLLWCSFLILGFWRSLDQSDDHYDDIYE